MKKRAKRIAALGAVALLVLLYLFTFICAVFDFPNSERLFLASLVSTVGIPILLWIYIWIFDQVQKRKNEVENEHND